MIKEMWLKKHKQAMTKGQEYRLYDMAWRLLNNLLPGYLKFKF